MTELFMLLRKQFPFFENELLTEIQEKGMAVEIEPEEEILHEGQLIRSFPLVLEGALRIVRNDVEGNELLLYYLNSGEVCSMALTCCVGDRQSNVKIVAEQKSLIIRIPVEFVDKWMTQFPGWKLFIMNAYRQRFDELLETIDSIAFLKMDERLDKFLRNRFMATGDKYFTGKHQDIAFQLNTSREVVSRLLKKMEQKGLVKLSRNQIDFSMLIED